MIPAVLIYSLFPKDRIGVRGPLGALTISATGAFAAYVIVFGLAYPIVSKSEDALAGMVRPIWSVSARVKLVDEAGNDVNPAWLNGLVVELRPDFYNTANEYVSVLVPEINGSLPRVVLRVPNFGSQVIDTAAPTGLAKDEFHKKISVQDTVEIRKFPEYSAGHGATH
jgi:hypothetical protein